MKKILVIEDNFEVNENLCEILELSGYDVASALDGKKGVEQANTFLPDLILCDVMMPHLDGYGVLSILSQNERTAHIPLIFLTAKSEMKDLRKGMNLGAADYILKPFDDVDLLQSIALRLTKTNASASNTNPGGQGILGIQIDQKITTLKESLIDKYEIRLYAAKSPVYLSSAHPRYIFFIIKGIVRLQKTNNIGKRITIDLITADTIFGEVAGMQSNTYQEDATALTDCEIIPIPIAAFLDLFQTDNAFAIYCYQNALLRIANRNTAYLEMAYSAARRKVAISLIKYAQSIYGQQLDNGLSIYLPREELAELVGSAKETIIRTLSDFKSEGLIEIADNRIVITNMNELINMPV